MDRILTGSAISSDTEKKARLQSALKAALEAGSIMRDLYEKPHQIQMKGEIDLVTEVDLASEALILAILREDFPEIPILAEESAGLNIDDTDRTIWIIDPLDGTTNFAHGLPFFCVSIALYEERQPVLGVIYCPILDELFYTYKGEGAWLNGKKLAVTQTDFLINSLIATGFPYNIHDKIEDVMYQVQTILPKVRDIRRCGAAAIDLAYLACGRFDGLWEMDLKPWDTAAGILLVEEAGGRISDFTGKPFSPFFDEILASNGILHDKLLPFFK